LLLRLQEIDVIIIFGYRGFENALRIGVVMQRIRSLKNDMGTS